MNLTASLHGAALCASLIVTIGAQNAFVLRQGLMRSHIGKIVLLCTLSDFILIGAGVGGASALMQRAPGFVHVVLYAGLAYLAWFGVSALRRAWRPGHAALDANSGAAGAREAQGGRVAFALGAMAVSALWFVGLGYGARLLAPWFKRPGAWRALDAGIGAMVLTIAATQLR